MPRYRVRKYTLEVGEIEADCLADASLLLRYGHGPMSWQLVGQPTIKLINEDNKVIQIDNHES